MDVAMKNTLRTLKLAHLRHLVMAVTLLLFFAVALSARLLADNILAALDGVLQFSR